jgi:hypothetical protein
MLHRRYALLITGTHHNCHPFVFPRLDQWHSVFGDPLFVVFGDAAGVDAQAGKWCFVRKQPGSPGSPHKAAWEIHGRGAAGGLRNQEMVLEALMLAEQHIIPPRDVHCLGFPGSNSVGTWDCMARSSNAGLTSVNTNLSNWLDLLRKEAA